MLKVCVEKLRRRAEKVHKTWYQTWHKTWYKILYENADKSPVPGLSGPGCVSHYPTAETFCTDIHIHIQVCTGLIFIFLQKSWQTNVQQLRFIAARFRRCCRTSERAEAQLFCKAGFTIYCQRPHPSFLSRVQTSRVRTNDDLWTFHLRLLKTNVSILPRCTRHLRWISRERANKSKSLKVGWSSRTFWTGVSQKH